MNPCIIWTKHVGNDGYARMYCPNRQNITTASIVVWEEANGAVPEGMQVDHKCKNHLCVNLEHLQLLTPLENNRSAHAKLTVEQVREIKALLGTVTKAELARRYGVSFMSITHIERGKTWKEV